VSPIFVSGGGVDFATFELGDSPAGAVELIWAHGWGQTHAALLPLAQAMRRSARSVLLDFPGFGAAPEPSAAWGTADYADAVAEWLAGRAPTRRIWVGHSFGGRVGLRLAARHPEALAGLCLIATPGLPLRRSPAAQVRVMARRFAFRLARQLTSEGPARERLRTRFGSTDYRQATPLMRRVLVKAVNEDLSEAARAVRIPAVLIYGDRDRDAPPDIGMRLSALMPQSRLVVLRGFGHLDIVTDGHHQIAQRLGEFLEQVR
jgi:pimeloyl-ACP methyl ester carboxylesterase